MKEFKSLSELTLYHQESSDVDTLHVYLVPDTEPGIQVFVTVEGNMNGNMYCVTFKMNGNNLQFATVKESEVFIILNSASCISGA